MTDALDNVESFNRETTDGNYHIDHGTDRSIGSQIQDDGLADPEGEERRSKPVERGAAPPYVLQDFDWRSRVDQETGEVSWFMGARREAVERAAKSAPERVLAARSRLTKEDREVVKQLAIDTESLQQTLYAVDQYIVEQPLRLLADQVTRGAIQVARWVEQITGAMSTLKPDQETPDWIHKVHEMALETGRRAAICYEALKQLKPDYELNYNAAAWNVMRYQASQNQQRFMNPDELKAKVENEKNATVALVANL